MNMIATNVLDWSGQDDAGGSDYDGGSYYDLNTPFKIETESQGFILDWGGNPTIENWKIKLYTRFYSDWSVTGMQHGATSPLKTGVSSPTRIEEPVTLSGSTDISASYPAHGIYPPNLTPTGLIRDLGFNYAATPGSSAHVISDGSGRVKFSSSFLKKIGDDTLHGVIDLDYSTANPMNYSVQTNRAGIHYFLASNSKTGQQEIFTIETSDATTQTITVRECTTDEPIEGAIVTFAGSSYTTDANGFVSLGYYSSGQTIPITITATGQADYEGFIST